MRRRSSHALTIISSLIVIATPLMAADVDWPMSLKAIGDGYPKPGNPCRRVSDTNATAPFKQPGAILIACPAKPSNILVRRFAAANSARVAGEVDGFTIVAVPIDTATGAAAGRQHTETGHLRCDIAGERPHGPCSYAIVRKGGGISVIEIAWPDGRKRAVFVANGRITGADIDHTKTTAGMKPRVTAAREVDQYVVTVGNERYEIPILAISAN